MPNVRVLVVDDEPGLRESLARSLRFEGYTVETAGDGAEALPLLAGRDFDVALLDVMMPRLDGIELCRRIRADGRVLPILMLTAKGAVDDRVRGLRAGADDYVVKPFALEELLARMHAVRRRSTGSGSGDVSGDPADDQIVRVADLVLDPRAWRVTRDGQEVHLTRTEFSLLEVLARNRSQVLTRGQLYELVWGFDLDRTSNNLDVYVSYLRRKLERGGRSRLVHTVRGVGFVLRPPTGGEPDEGSGGTPT